MKKFLYIIALSVLFAACQNTDTSNENAVDENTSTIETTTNTANIVEETISVSGMTCTGCENSIETSISKIEGIKEVKASHLDSTTIVKYDKSLTNIDAISQNIEKTGYKVLSN